MAHQLQSPLVAIPLEMLEEEDEGPYLSPSSDVATTPQRDPSAPGEAKPLLLHPSNVELATIATVIDSVRKRQLAAQPQPASPAEVAASPAATPVWADRMKALRAETRAHGVERQAGPYIALSPAPASGPRRRGRSDRCRRVREA